MLYLTDQPQTTQPLLPPDTSWTQADYTTLSPDDQALWTLFGDARPLWIAGDPHAEDTSRMALIDEASASQYATLLEALKKEVRIPSRLICLALAGTGFRGQRDRPWTALRGNLHLTAHYQTVLPAASSAAGLTALPAVATAHTIEQLSGGRLRPKVKWVNDIMIDGHKVSGVLTSTQVQGNLITRVVFGIGLNVTRAPDIAPSPQVRKAGALQQFDAACAASLPHAFHTLVQTLDEALQTLTQEGPASLVAAYRQRAAFIGKPVRIWPDPSDPTQPATTPLADGIVQKLNDDLSLQIESHDTPIRTGRMEVLSL